MEISIIGAGNQGTALGAAFARAGHRVVFGGHASQAASSALAGPLLSVAEAVQRSSIVAVVVPSWHLDEALQALRESNPEGKVIIDVTNPLTPAKDWELGFSTSNAERVREALPGTKVVKAFNTVFSAWLRNGGRAFGEQLTGFVASDDLEAKRAVLELAGTIGLDPVDAGGLKAARFLEAVGVMMVNFGAFTSLGWDLGLRLVHQRPGSP